MRSTADFSGVRVLGGKKGTRRIGKVLRAVFYPGDLRLAGFIVKRPDMLWMFKRSDRFLAWDSLEVVDGKVVAASGRESWDGAAIKRLGLDWDAALILQGMPLISHDGEVVGSIDDVEFDGKTGRPIAYKASSGLGAKTLLGSMSFPAQAVQRFTGEGLVLKRDVEIPEHDGGLASKAGEQAAVVGNFVRTSTKAAGAAVGNIAEKADDGMQKLGYQAGKAIGDARREAGAGAGGAGAGGSGGSDAEGKKGAATDGKAEDGKTDSLVQSGSRALGRQIGRTRKMFKSFSDEYKKASK